MQGIRMADFHFSAKPIGICDEGDAKTLTLRKPRAISAATTKTGLTVRCQLDTGQYPSGIVVSDAEMAAINIQRAEFHGEWNYTISPNPHRPNRAFIS